LRTGDGSAKRISDFLSMDELYELELYQNVYRPLGVNYQVAVGLPAPRPLILGIALNRAERDFDDVAECVEGGERAVRPARPRLEIERRSAELERGVCLVGPHRDDLELQLGDQPAKGFASHGESWSLALALRLAAYELLRGEGSDPVLLLDDVFAELDTTRRRALATVAASAEQVLVTAAVAEDIPTGWDAREVAIQLRDEDSGRISVVQT